MSKELSDLFKEKSILIALNFFLFNKKSLDKGGLSYGNKFSSPKILIFDSVSFFLISLAVI